MTYETSHTGCSRLSPSARSGIYTDTSGKLFSAVDYPPGYLYVLWGLGELYRLLFHGLDNPVLVRAWLKLPNVIADFGVAFGVMRLARLCWPMVATETVAATLLLGPMLWLNSAYWAQVDSMAALRRSLDACCCLLSGVF